MVARLQAEARRRWLPEPQETIGVRELAAAAGVCAQTVINTFQNDARVVDLRAHLNTSKRRYRVFRIPLPVALEWLTQRTPQTDSAPISGRRRKFTAEDRQAMMRARWAQKRHARRLQALAATA